MYIERRHRHFLARHDIPRQLWPAFGGLKRFSTRLKHTDTAKVEIEAKELEVSWLRQIERARRGLPPVPPEAQETPPVAGARTFDHQGWRKWVKGASGADQQREREGHVVEAVERHMGLVSWQELDQPGHEQEREEFGHLVALGTGDYLPLLDGLDGYMASLQQPRRGRPAGLVQTSRDLKKSQIEKLGETFATTADVTTDGLQAWITAKVKSDDASKLTVHKYIGSLRDYLRYVAKHLKVRVNVKWDELDFEGREKLDKLPYPPAAVVKFEKIARDRGDQQLAGYICIARYTGARASEIHGLRGGDIDLTAMAINVRGTKNKSANRVCPIHADLLPVLTRMTEATGSGPLFPGIKRTALTQAFKRLKVKEKARDGQPIYGELHDFHSIRRTIIKMFRDVGAREEIVASFVGHKIKTITYGLYAGLAVPLAVQAETMALLSYPVE